MTKRSDIGGTDSEELSPEHQFAERFAVTAEEMGMPRMTGRLLGWLLVCDPPAQSSRDLEHALGVSRASISIATRLLEATRLIVRRTRPGQRGDRFEVDPRAFMRLADAERYRAFRLALEECLTLMPDSQATRAGQLREVRDFYAYLEREIGLLIERYQPGMGQTTP